MTAIRRNGLNDERRVRIEASGVSVALSGRLPAKRASPSAPGRLEDQSLRSVPHPGGTDGRGRHSRRLASAAAANPLIEWSAHSLSCGRVDQRGMTRSRWRLRRNGLPMLPSWTGCSSRDSLPWSDRWRARGMRSSFSVHPAHPKLSSASFQTRGRPTTFSSPSRSVPGRIRLGSWRLGTCEHLVPEATATTRSPVVVEARRQRWRRLPLTTNASFCARVSCFTTYSRASAFPTDRNAS